MAKTETNVTNLKINRGTYANIQANISSIGENELIITTDKNIPVPTQQDVDKIVRVDNTGEYDLDDCESMTEDEIAMMFIEKGSILTMNLDGTDRQYRVLKKVGGTVVEVLTQFDPFGSTAIKYNTTSTTAIFSDGSEGQKYENSDLDTAVNVTWYNTLTSTAKEAIVDKNIIQDMWYTNDASGNPDYRTVSRITSKKDGATLTVGSRHIYAPSIQDFIDYLEVTPEMTTSNTTWTADSLRAAFGYSESSAYQYWFSSAHASAVISSIYIGMNTCYPDDANATANMRVRPAFQIDLSKIQYTEV